MDRRDSGVFESSVHGLFDAAFGVHSKTHRLFRAFTFFFIDTMSETVRASHILAKHTQSRNPVSRRTNERITLSKDEARAELTAIQAKLVQAGESGGHGAVFEMFTTIAQSRSDCGSCHAGGDLGQFSRGMMQQPFEEATYQLKVGEMSGIVDTDSGLHLIFRTE